MSKKAQKQISVYADWNGMSGPILMGTLFAAVVRGREIFSFEYDMKWLKKHQSYNLDPALQLFQGQQYAPVHQSNFGIFLDSSPDRWGRFLMNRREALLAREEKRNERQLLESDYLLGVYDKHRMGALRFKMDPKGPFLDNNNELSAPPWTSLREIESASLALEKEDAENKRDYKIWLKMLIAPGGSLGGARPKASVVDDAHHPWIAKFPSRSDENNIGGWEMVAYKLAHRAKIDMAIAKAEKFNSRHHTFLSKRFDRTNSGKRVHFASALTLLQRSDGDDASNGTSYLEIAEFIMRQGARATRDLEQLWRRIVFSVCISNVDDHLRNHGFIFEPNHGWILSPAFDINPSADGNGLKLNISEFDNSQDLDLTKSVAANFRIKANRAKSIIKEVLNAVRHWKKEATVLGISQSEQSRMTRAFRIANEIGVRE